MKIFFSFYFLLFLSTGVHSFENTKIKIGNFLINKYEITIQEFQAYADTNNYKTLAEQMEVVMNGELAGKKEMAGTLELLMDQLQKVY